MTDLVNHEVIIGIQPANDGYASLYSVLDNEKMTIYYDKDKSHRLGTVMSRRCDWANHAEDILNIIIDESFSKLKFREMNEFFEGLNKLQAIEGIENLNTSTVKSMNQMFCGCSSLKNLDVSGFNTGKVTTMYGMFAGCSGLTGLDVSGFETDNVTDMERMFGWCSNLTSLDLSNFNTENTTNMAWMFYGCDNLSAIYVGDGWNTEKVESGDEMFWYCTNLVGGAGTEFCKDYSGIDYAHVDGGPENPGYLTYKESTGVQNYIADEGFCPAVYSLSGVKVRSEGKGFNGLPAGVYIVGGKKVVVK